MESIFLSYSFSKPEDRVIVGEIEDLFRSFGVVLRTGRNLGGNELTDQVKTLIRQCNGLVAIASRRDELAGGGWVTHPWIRDEFGYARAEQKRAIALIEDGVKTNGAYQAHEYIPFDREHVDAAMLRLAKTLGIWMDEAGSRLKVRLLPDEVLEEMAAPVCEYQFIARGNTLGWRPAVPVFEPGGAYLHLDGVREDYLIEVRVTNQNLVRKSRATAQTMPVMLE